MDTPGIQSQILQDNASHMLLLFIFFSGLSSLFIVYEYLTSGGSGKVIVQMLLISCLAHWETQYHINMYPEGFPVSICGEDILPITKTTRAA